MQNVFEKTTAAVLRLWVVALLAGVPAVGVAAETLGASLLQPQGLEWAGIHSLRQLDPSLTGAGVRLAVVCRSFTYSEADEPQNDYRPNMRHSCFQNADLRFHEDSTFAAGVSPHSTAICSILFGQDTQGIAADLDPFLYEGALPEAEGHIYEFWHFVTQYVFTRTAPAVDVMAASFGQAFEAWWTRGIESWAEHKGLIVVGSIGNGENASDPPFYPGAGANTIGVGVVSSVNAADPATSLSHFALAYPEQSSRGPTDDGRCKPDLIAPGNCLAAGTEDDVTYISSGNWSSFSTPVAAGVVGLLVQAAKEDPQLTSAVAPVAGNCVMKAILMNSATKLPYWHKGQLGTEDDHEVPLDYVQGAGMVNAVDAYLLLKAGRITPGGVATAGWDTNQLDADSSVRQVYRIVVDDAADKVIAATLVWNRHYEAEYPFERITDNDRDLRLEVLAVDPENPDNDRRLSYSDSSVDNVEHVFIETLPEYTMYEIVVSYSDRETQAAAPAERYAVAWSMTEKLPDENILWHDLNADGIVDEQDFGVLMNNWITGLKSPGAYVIGDVNKDGRIDVDDMQMLYAQRNRRADWRAATATN